ncbi:MAG: hypothetical protein LBS18_02195, partial [Clostridiales bacterium]|nr:hypothetical protein [Clostridiales bacterium]
KHLAEAGFDPLYGARPLRRAIQQQVEDSLSEELLSGRLKLGDHVEAYAKDDKLCWRIGGKKRIPKAEILSE